MRPAQNSKKNTHKSVKIVFRPAGRPGTSPIRGFSFFWGSHIHMGIHIHVGSTFILGSIFIWESTFIWRY